MIKVATIINTHGLKGECKLYLVTDDTVHRFKKGRELWIDEKEPVHVSSFREQKGFGYVKFDEITTIEQAEQYKTKSLYIKKEDLPELDADEFYYHELMDCVVYNTNQEELGKVVDILETGANLVLRIQHGNQSFLLPFVEVFVKEVDKEKKKITIEEMEGLR